MGKQVRVRVFDDVDGELVEAAHSDVPLRWGKRSVTLDLSAAHFKEIDAFLGRFLAAGTPEGKVNAPSAPVRGRQPKAYYDGMQAFAAEHGVKIPRDPSGRKWEYDLARLPDGTPLRAAYEASVTRPEQTV